MNSLPGLLALSLIILLSSSEAKVSISCTRVIHEIAPCSDFILKSNDPSQACCNGVKTLSDEAKSQKDRTDICQCLKQGLSGIGKYDPKRIPQLPKACGLSMTLPPIDQNTDCSK
ncbi:putative plant lipid transfer protein/Par allergen [Lupinus albus]|uniref:Non-specific lipid-transfer protein n=1 Tax=Lupinus albus TaxID=3870 RepID=A0A6A4PAW1_LUPAL|nr:putative plant lipid transfer protein/Par allergen [Lupinus albus]